MSGKPAIKRQSSRRVLAMMGATLLLASLLHFFHLPVWLTGAALIIGGAGLVWGAQVGKLWRNLILTGGLFAILPAVYLTYDWNSSDALVSVILFASWLKVWEVQTRRDILWLVLASWMIVGFGFIYDQSAISLLILFIVSLSGLFTIMLSQDQQQVIPLRDTFGMVFRLAGMAMPVMVVLFLFFPRVTGSLLDLGFVFGVPMMIETDAEKQQQPLDGELEFGELAERTISTNRVLSATFKLDTSPYYNRMPPLDKMFWRGPVLWRYDGTGWHEREGFHQRSARMKGRFKRTDLTRTIKLSGKISAYKVRLVPHQKHWLYALDVPMTPVPSAFLTRDLQLTNMNPVREFLTYDVESFIKYRYDGVLSDEDKKLGLQLPEGLNPRMVALGKEWARTIDNPRDIVNKAVNFLAEDGFSYTAKPVTLATPHMMDDFLFNQKRGFATHYASAFVQLMRAAGLPARMVAGYKGGTPFDFTETLMVMEEHAYAWAEVWVDEDYGWTRIDPARPTQAIAKKSGVSGAGLNIFGGDQDEDSAATDDDEKAEGSAGGTAGTGQSASGNTSDANSSMVADRKSGNTNFMSWLTGGWENWIIDFDASRQRDLNKAINMTGADWRSMLLVSGGAVTVLVLAFLIAQRGLVLWRRHQYHRNMPVELLMYRQVLDKLARHGLDRVPGEGPTAFLKRIEAEASLPDAALTALTAITEQFVSLRFGNPETTARNAKLTDLRQKSRRFSLK